MARDDKQYRYGLQGEPGKPTLRSGKKRRKHVVDMASDSNKKDFAAEDFEDSDAFWSYMDRKYGPHTPEPQVEQKSEPKLLSQGYYERYDPKTGTWEQGASTPSNASASSEKHVTPYNPDWWKTGEYSKYYSGNYSSYSGGSTYTYVRTPKTSDSHPIDVDFFPEWAVPTPGKLGMTFAPGKTQEKGLTGDHARDLEKDLTRLVGYYRMNHLVTLNETSELEALKIPDLRQRVQAKGAGTIWYPFPDMTAPPNMEHAAELVDMILDRLYKGENVIVHCKGGLGRTGTIAACTLIELGFSPTDAIATVRKIRPFTIQEKCQENFIYRYWWFRT